MLALLSAAWFALRPAETHRAFVKHMGRATLFSVLCGLASGFATVAKYASGDAIGMNQKIQACLMGSAEALTTAIFGFALLSVVSLLTAVGERRLAARSA